jgi:cytochrome c oxidase accessory protein FixG
VWCGWACPQTVFLDGIYRRIERWIEGPREQRVRLAAAPWTWSKLWRRVLLHGAYVVVSFVLAHVFLSYFVSLPAVIEMVQRDPAAHPEAFGVAAFLTGVLYFDFAFFREQFCVVMCPYGRLQSVLLDPGSLVIGYDAARGEPRGKVKDPARGACIDCNRCVAVCPTGIDIRNGLQLDCIGCTACIDACDEIMDKVGQPRGLIRYDSQEGLAGRKSRLWRPRVVAYTVLLVVGAVVATFAFRTRTEVEANLLRLPGAPFVIEDGRVRNSYELHIVNKRSVRTTFRLAAEGPAEVVLPVTEVTLDSLAQTRVPMFASVERAGWKGRFAVKVNVVAEGAAQVRRAAQAPFLGP